MISALRGLLGGKKQKQKPILHELNLHRHNFHTIQVEKSFQKFVTLSPAQFSKVEQDLTVLMDAHDFTTQYANAIRPIHVEAAVIRSEYSELFEMADAINKSIHYIGRKLYENRHIIETTPSHDRIGKIFFETQLENKKLTTELRVFIEKVNSVLQQFKDFLTNHNGSLLLIKQLESGSAQYDMLEKTGFLDVEKWINQVELARNAQLAQRMLEYIHSTAQFHFQDAPLPR